jgi:hypothetical protein
MTATIENMLRFLWLHSTSLMQFCVGFALLFSWLLLPVPTFGELSEVNGLLESYAAEEDQSWFGKYLAPNRHSHMIFKVAGRDGRFWTDLVGSENVHEIFPRPGIPVRFSYQSHFRFLQAGTFNGAVKSYGLVANGVEVASPQTAMEVDSFFQHFLLPPLGLLAIFLAWSSWKKELAKAQMKEIST